MIITDEYLYSKGFKRLGTKFKLLNYTVEFTASLDKVYFEYKDEYFKILTTTEELDLEIGTRTRTFEPWTLWEAVDWIKKYEPTVAEHNWHIGLTGSVLFIGESKKDLDIILYPHCEKTGETAESLLRLLDVEDISLIKEENDEENERLRNYPVADRVVYVKCWKGKRIDFFYFKNDVEKAQVEEEVNAGPRYSGEECPF